MQKWPISLWPWQFKISKIIIDVSIVEFCKGCSQMSGRLFIEDFVHLGYSLYMGAAGFEVFPFQIIKHIYRSNVI